MKLLLSKDFQRFLEISVFIWMPKILRHAILKEIWLWNFNRQTRHSKITFTELFLKFVLLFENKETREDWSQIRVSNSNQQTNPPKSTKQKRWTQNENLDSLLKETTRPPLWKLVEGISFRDLWLLFWCFEDCWLVYHNFSLGRTCTENEWSRLLLAGSKVQSGEEKEREKGGRQLGRLALADHLSNFCSSWVILVLSTARLIEIAIELPTGKREVRK